MRVGLIPERLRKYLNSIKELFEEFRYLRNRSGINPKRHPLLVLYSKIFETESLPKCCDK